MDPSPLDAAFYNLKDLGRNLVNNSRHANTMQINLPAGHTDVRRNLYPLATWAEYASKAY